MLRFWFSFFVAFLVSRFLVIALLSYMLFFVFTFLYVATHPLAQRVANNAANQISHLDSSYPIKNPLQALHLRTCYMPKCGPGSSVGIATGYGLDCPGSNPGGGEIFRTSPGAHPASCTKCTGSFPEVKSGRSVTLTPHTFQCRSQERVELYLYSPYGTYALCGASVPVQGCTLTLPYMPK